MKKICIVLTTRGNYAKFKKLIRLIPQSGLELQLIVGGELLLSDRVVSFFDLPSSRKVYFNLSGDNHLTMAKSVGLAINEFATAFDSLRPDIILLVGDRFETFAAASAAYLSRIPIAHLEGGEKSGSLDDALRYSISELSGIHFPATKKSGAILQNRGFSNVYPVGSTSIDALAELAYKDRPNFLSVEKRTGAGAIIDAGERFILAVMHPDTCNNDVIHETGQLIKAIDDLKLPTFWLSANLDAGSGKIGGLLRQYRDEKKPDFIHFFKSLPIEYFGYLLKYASCIVGNSSAGVREASFFGTPNVSIGMRQNGRETGRNTVFAKAERGHIVQKVMMQLDTKYEPDFLYGDGKASERILEVIRK